MKNKTKRTLVGPHHKLCTIGVKKLEELPNHEESILYWCYKNKIPIFCPALTDGGIGDVLYYHSQFDADGEITLENINSHPGPKAGLQLDITQDLMYLMSMCQHSAATGSFSMGSGVPKHHVLNANCMKMGLDYAVYVTTAQEFDGSDSGAEPREARAWCKLRPDCKAYKLQAEATLVCPLLIAKTFFKYKNVENVLVRDVQVEGQQQNVPDNTHKTNHSCDRRKKK